MPSIIRRMRTRPPTCLSVGFGAFFMAVVAGTIAGLLFERTPDAFLLRMPHLTFLVAGLLTVERAGPDPFQKFAVVVQFISDQLAQLVWTAWLKRKSKQTQS